MRFVNLAIALASGFAVTAFSLDKRAGAIVASSKPNAWKALPSKQANAFLLKQSQIFASGTDDFPGANVAAKETQGKEKVHLGSIWNDNTKLAFNLAVWYLGNIYYNIYNKKACIALGKSATGSTNAVWALAALQLLVGVLFVVPLWITGIRPAPKLTADNWRELTPVGIWAALAHAFSVLALSAGAVSFGQIVKAGEPVFAAATNALVLKDIDHPVVYLTLLPIIGGVAVASLKELSFTWTALFAASAANQAAALKNVVSKGVMSKPWAKGLGPQNFYTVVTLLALISTLPLVAFFDLKDAVKVYNQVVQAGTSGDVIKYTLLSGLTFYLYNEAAFKALDRLNPVTHSVANTLKRVVIIVASCLVFQTPITMLGSVGSAVAILGTLLYSLAKRKFHHKAH